MPDVGTLYLKVESDASSAATGLGQLADALTRIKEAVPQSLGLDQVRKDLNKFAKEVNQAKATNTVLKNVAEFGKGLKEIVSATNSAAKGINTEPITTAIDEIKTAVADGMHLGQAGTQIKNIRDALNGEWNTENAYNAGMALTAIGEGAKSIGEANLGTVAKNVSAVAKSLNELAGDDDIVNNMRTALSGDWGIADAQKVGDVLTSIASGANSLNGTSLGTKAKDISAVAKALSEYADSSVKVLNAVGSGKPTIDIAGIEAVTQNAAGSIGKGMTDEKDAVAQAATEVAQIIIDALKERFEIHSPSRVGIAIGYNLGSSLGIGMDKSRKVVEASAEKLAEVYRSLNVKDSVASPVEALNAVFREGVTNVRYYSSALDAVLPKLSAISSAEMAEKWNARFETMTDRELKVLLAEANGLLTVNKELDNVQGPKKFSEGFKEATSTLESAKVELVEVGDIITSHIVEPLKNAYETAMTFFNMLNNPGMGLNNDTGRGWDSPFGYLMSGEDYNRSVSSENALSLYHSPWFTPGGYESVMSQWKPDFVMDDSWKQSMYQQMVDMYNEFGWFQQNAPRLEAGTEPLRLYGEVAEEATQKVESTVDGVRSAARVINETGESAKNAAVSLDDFYNSLNEIDLLKQMRSEITKELGKGILSREFDDKKIIQYELRIRSLTDKINKLEDAEYRASDEAVNLARNKVTEFMDKTEIELTREKLEQMTDAIARQYAAGKLNETQFVEKIKTLQNLRDKLDELTEAEERANSFAGRLGKAWGSVRTGMEKLFPTLTSMLKRFGQIAKYRILRGVLRHITSGFSEGVKNVYQYSKAVGTDLAPAMDQAATALQQMKNSIGAAAAPVIQALVPVLQSVANHFINLINYVNQFFALLNGQNTWTRALPEQAEAFEKSTKSAKDSSKAMKDLLADWDELNIIQSNSNGGSGAGSGKTEEEYRNMFEEVNKFDQEVKDVLSYIDKNLGGLPNIIKKAGAILVGWKFSKAFSGFLGTLGKLVAGGALVSLGLDLTYGSGFEAGSKGFFDTSDVVTSIVGSLATALGGSIISKAAGLGGGIGFTIGLGVGVIATLYGYIQGEADLVDKLKWGTSEMTPEQLKDYVKSRFTFDIEAEIGLLDANIKDRADAEKVLTDAVNGFTSSLTYAKIRVGMKADDRETALTNAYTSAQKVISEIQNTITTNGDALTTTVSISPMYDDDGNVVDILSQAYTADETLKEYFKGLGKDLADAMLEGEKDGWTDGEMEAVLALMEHQRNIVAQAEAMQRDLTFEMNYRFNLNNLTRDNAKEIAEQEQKLIDEYKQKFMADRETARNAAVKNLAWTETAIEDYKNKGLDTTKLEEAKATYEKLIDEYLDPAIAEAAWNAKIQESMNNIRQDWITALANNDYGLIDYKFERDDRFFTYRDPNTVFANDLYASMFEDDPVSAATKAIEEYFNATKNLVPDYLKNIMGSFNISMWDISGEDARSGIVAALRKFIGDDYAEQVLKNIGIPVDEIQKLFREKVNEAIHEEEIKTGIVVEIDGIESVISEKVFNQLEADVEDAMKDTYMAPAEKNNLIKKYGEGLYKYMLDYLEFSLDSDGYEKGQSKLKNALAVVASTGMKTFNRGNTSPYIQGGSTENAVLTSPANNQQYTSNIARGAEEGTKKLLDALDSILRVAERIDRKEFKVSLLPSSAWGNHNVQSQAARDKVTGGNS